MLANRLQQAHRVGCPILTYATSDPAASIQAIAKALPKAAIVTWDSVQGLTTPPTPNKAESEQAAAKIAEAAECEPSELLNPAMAVQGTTGAPENTVLVVQNAHRVLTDPVFMQAVWNSRDVNKAYGRMIVLMGTAISTPIELRHDVIEFDEALPDRDELQKIISDLANDVGIAIDKAQATKAAEACQGLSAFAAEQLAAMALSRTGINVESIWEGKYAKINETPGLSVITGGTFKDIAGCDGIKEFLGGIMKGYEAPNCVVFIDEIEKALGGAATDTSGVGQDQLGKLLEWMEDENASGLIMNGPPGTTKTQIAKATGGEHGVPTIKFDLGGLKDKHVGESQQRIREALKVLKSISGGRTLWLATCNSMTVLPPELRRRFRYGTWFNDLPNREEREAIWDMYLNSYALPPQSPVMFEETLTGAEIKGICEIAWRMQISPEKAKGYIVPVAKSSAATIAGLREAAHRTMVSSTTGQTYEKAERDEKPKRQRKMAV